MSYRLILLLLASLMLVGMAVAQPSQGVATEMPEVSLPGIWVGDGHIPDVPELTDTIDNGKESSEHKRMMWLNKFGHMATNSIYADAFWALSSYGSIYSLCYDGRIPLSVFTSLSLQAGVGTTVADINGTEKSLIILYPEVNLMLGTGRGHFTTGMGLFVSPFFSLTSPFAKLGYRYQPWEGGTVFFFNVAPFIQRVEESYPSYYGPVIKVTHPVQLAANAGFGFALERSRAKLTKIDAELDAYRKNHELPESSVMSLDSLDQWNPDSLASGHIFQSTTYTLEDNPAYTGYACSRLSVGFDASRDRPDFLNHATTADSERGSFAFSARAEVNLGRSKKNSLGYAEQRVYDEAGCWLQQRMISYAHALHLRGYQYMRLGAAFQQRTTLLNWDATTFYDQINPDLGFIYPTQQRAPKDDRETHYNLHAGVFYSGKHHEVGLAFRDVFESRHGMFGNTTQFPVREWVLNAYAAYHFAWHDKWIASPSFEAQFGPYRLLRPQVSVSYAGKYYGVVGLRNRNFLDVSVGGSPLEGLRVGAGLTFPVKTWLRAAGNVSMLRVTARYQIK
ncbi:MAG: type IX secretion system membrane protein PorP/SprF [Flavobacteriales bacterium]|nr:type IX secretion system membrane protein PorP/SprF [Flavobacteriales bacterium]